VVDATALLIDSPPLASALFVSVEMYRLWAEQEQGCFSSVYAKEVKEGQQSLSYVHQCAQGNGRSKSGGGN